MYTMGGNKMELTQIRYFLEVAKTQHMTKTAQNLHVAQPALSQSIKRLEKSLGVPLFVSKGRNITLTAYGKYLQKKLEPIIEQLDNIPKQLETMAKLEGETIHMNVLAASSIVIEAVIEYKKEKGELNFQFLQNQQDELFDIMVTTKLFFQKHTDEKNNYVCEEKIYLAVPDTEKYKGRTSITLKEVENEEFVSLYGSKQFRYICDRFCQYAGFQPKIIFESDNPEAVKNMIAANLGIGFWPEFTWGSVNDKNVRLLEIESPICQRDIIISYNQNKIDNHNVLEFFDFLKNYIETKRANAGCMK